MMDYSHAIKLASLGSNLVEHCFGTNRHFAHEDKTMVGFERSLSMTILHNAFAKKAQINTKINKRSSTSEIHLEPEQEENKANLLSFGERVATIIQFLSDFNVSTQYDFVHALEIEDDNSAFESIT